ncbi:MAG: hypothetical protein ACK58T_06115, partial [Phycisphaerae bacterium]
MIGSAALHPPSLGAGSPGCHGLVAWACRRGKLESAKQPPLATEASGTEDPAFAVLTVGARTPAPVPRYPPEHGSVEKLVARIQ